MVISGVGGMILGSASGAVSRLPTWAEHGWYALIAAIGALTLLGITWKKPTTGLNMERAAMVPLALVLFAFSVLIFSAGGWRGFVTGNLVTSLAVAAAVRARQIGRELKLLAGVEESHHGGG